MAKIPAFPIIIIVIFSALLSMIYIPGFVMSEDVVDKLKDFSAILGLISLIVTSIWAYKKKLFTEGFEKFKVDYNVLQKGIRIEIDDFKADVRGYVKDNEAERRNTLNRIVDLYADISKQINEQNKRYEIDQAGKPYREKELKERLQSIEKELKVLDSKISHVEDCVNNKDLRNKK